MSPANVEVPAASTCNVPVMVDDDCDTNPSIKRNGTAVAVEEAW